MTTLAYPFLSKQTEIQLPIDLALTAFSSYLLTISLGKLYMTIHIIQKVKTEG